MANLCRIRIGAHRSVGNGMEVPSKGIMPLRTWWVVSAIVVAASGCTSPQWEDGCHSRGQTLIEAEAGAEVIFTGRVASAEVPFPADSRYFNDITIATGETLKGKHNDVWLTSGNVSGRGEIRGVRTSNHYTWTVGEKYLIFARYDVDPGTFLFGAIERPDCPVPVQDTTCGGFASSGARGDGCSILHPLWRSCRW